MGLWRISSLAVVRAVVRAEKRRGMDFMVVVSV